MLARKARMKSKQHIVIRCIREPNPLELNLDAFNRIRGCQRSLLVEQNNSMLER